MFRQVPMEVETGFWFEKYSWNIYVIDYDKKYTYAISASKRVNFEYLEGVLLPGERVYSSKRSALREQLAVQLRGIETCRIQLDRESYLIVDIYVWHFDNLVTRNFCSYM